MLKDLLERLEIFRDFSVPDNPREFGMILYDIGQLRDYHAVPELLRYFDDNTDYYDVMEMLIYAVESGESAGYVQALLMNIDWAWANSPY